MGIKAVLEYDRKYPEGSRTAIAEKMFLYALVRHAKPHGVVEIGVSRGHTLCWIAQAMKDNGFGKVIGVDNWSLRHGGRAGGPDPARRRVKALRLQDHAAVVTAESGEWLKGRPDKSVEIVWIDGGHDYETARLDIAESLRVARDLVVVHDSNNLPGVHKACVSFGGGVWLQGFRGFWLRNPILPMPRFVVPDELKDDC